MKDTLRQLNEAISAINIEYNFIKNSTKHQKIKSSLEVIEINVNKVKELQPKLIEDLISLKNINEV
jgi:hypothetical protein